MALHRVSDSFENQQVSMLSALPKTLFAYKKEVASSCTNSVLVAYGSHMCCVRLVVLNFQHSRTPSGSSLHFCCKKFSQVQGVSMDSQWVPILCSLLWSPSNNSRYCCNHITSWTINAASVFTPFGFCTCRRWSTDTSHHFNPVTFACCPV